MIKYYLNNPCEVISELNDHEVFIELEVAEETCQEGDYNYREPVFSRMVVDKKYITDTLIDFEDEYNSIIRDAKEKAKNIIRDAKNKSKDIDSQMQQNQQEIEKYEKKTGVFKQYLDMVSMDFEYLVYGSIYGEEGHFDKRIIESKKFNGGIVIDYSTNYASKRVKSGMSNLNEHISVTVDDCDNYRYTYHNVRVFKTLEELKRYLIDELDNKCNYVSEEDQKILKELGIEHKLFSKSREYDQLEKEKRAIKEIKELEKKIDELKNTEPKIKALYIKENASFEKKD